MPRVLPTSIERGLARVPENLRWDIAQFGIDLIGIFDPTPISDGANTLISLCRGDFLGAAISAVSMLPAGDLAKLLKLERYLGSLQSLVRMAKSDVFLRASIKPMMETFEKMLAKLPQDNAVVKKLRKEIDDFMRLPTAPPNFPLGSIKHVSPDILRGRLTANGFTKVADNTPSYRVASSRGGAAGPKEIWSKFDPDSNGYFVVRMDTQGHAFKSDVGGQISVVSQTKSGAQLTHGGRPHYHKEWVPASEYQKFLSYPTPNSVKFNDAGHLADGVKDLKGTHIPR